MMLSSTSHLAEPLVETSICPDGYFNNYNAECGYVFLLENRLSPHGATVQIAYALLYS